MKHFLFLLSLFVPAILNAMNGEPLLYPINAKDQLIGYYALNNSACNAKKSILTYDILDLDFQKRAAFVLDNNGTQLSNIDGRMCGRLLAKVHKIKTHYTVNHCHLFEQELQDKEVFDESSTVLVPDYGRKKLRRCIIQ